jgi:ComF family protein
MPIKKLLSWLLPYTCILCGNPSHRHQDLCLLCYQDLPTPKTSCQLCAISLQGDFTNLTCGQCLRQVRPFDATFTLFEYIKPIDNLLLELKFNQKLVNAQVLGELMAEKIQHDWYKNKPKPDVIIPIPLHPQRLRERGYNQAMEIARPIAKLCRIPINIKDCKRIKPTAPQAMLAAKERETNIKRAFTTNRRWDNCSIAVIDDVITTGNTVREFCHLLKLQGAKRIDVWCCARPQASLSYSQR